MSAITREMRSAYAFVERNINLIKRYWGWEIVWLFYSLVNSLAVTYIGAGMERISGQGLDTQYLITYLLVGTLIWSYLSVIFYAISEIIAWEGWEGTRIHVYGTGFATDAPSGNDPVRHRIRRVANARHLGDRRFVLPLRSVGREHPRSRPSLPGWT